LASARGQERRCRDPGLVHSLEDIGGPRVGGESSKLGGERTGLSRRAHHEAIAQKRDAVAEVAVIDGVRPFESGLLYPSRPAPREDVDRTRKRQGRRFAALRTGGTAAVGAGGTAPFTDGRDHESLTRERNARAEARPFARLRRNDGVLHGPGGAVAHQNGRRTGREE